jgi:acyl-CoA thioesterase I
MRSLGLVLTSILLLAGCAKDPDYDTGAAGSGGAVGGSGGGAGSGGAPGNGGSGLVGYVPPALPMTHPNPIVSRGAQVFASPTSGAASVVDGKYHTAGWIAGRPTEAAPAWVAIKVAAGPTRVLVSWDDSGTYDYKTPMSKAVYGQPGAYSIQVSADSTNGADGTWTTAVPTVTNSVRTRAHAVDFAGQSWVKMTVTAPSPQSGGNVSIGEIDVHDISATGTALPQDTWFFMGDSITAFAYDRRDANQPNFAQLVQTASSAYMPAMINGGIGSELTANGLARLDEMLSLNPDYRFFAITYGTNDEWGNKTDTTAFRTNLQMMIAKIKQAGREPVLSHIPYSNDGAHETLDLFNTVIDELTRDNQLQMGPDLTTYFKQHTDQLTDKVHPDFEGQKAMNRLWAEAMRRLYP